MLLSFFPRDPGHTREPVYTVAVERAGGRKGQDSIPIPPWPWPGGASHHTYVSLLHFPGSFIIFYLRKTLPT